MPRARSRPAAPAGDKAARRLSAGDRAEVAARQAAECDALLPPGCNGAFRHAQQLRPRRKRLVAERDALAASATRSRRCWTARRRMPMPPCPRRRPPAPAEKDRPMPLPRLPLRPRDGGGRIVCDAGCLRQLAQ
jgi:hypothetical protein